MKTDIQRVYIKIGDNTYYTSKLLSSLEMNELKPRKTLLLNDLLKTTRCKNV